MSTECRIADGFLRFRAISGPGCGYSKCSFQRVMVGATCMATALEKRRPLPVDALVPEPIFASTHAITIDAPPEQVWPWIAQMGAGRAGWYSSDAIDNGGTRSSGSIVPALQTVARGDIMPAVPGAKDAFVVAAVERNRDLVLTVPDGRGRNAVAWEHVLDPLPGDRTRLIVRGTRFLPLAGSRSCEATGRATPHLDRAGIRGAREASPSAAHRVCRLRPPHDGGATPAGHPAPQRSACRNERHTRTMANTVAQLWDSGGPPVCLDDAVCRPVVGGLQRRLSRPERAVRHRRPHTGAVDVARRGLRRPDGRLWMDRVEIRAAQPRVAGRGSAAHGAHRGSASGSASASPHSWDGSRCWRPCCGGPEQRNERRHMSRPSPVRIPAGEARDFNLRAAS